MATITRSKIRQDKDGALIRFYVVVGLDYQWVRKLSTAVDSAGFREYRRPREYTGPKAGRLYTALWKIPAKPLYDRLIRDAYNAKANREKAPDYRRDFLRQLEEIEQGKNPTKRRHWRTKPFS